MNSSPESSVYSEAKSEYTRQLCGFLTPSLESYFLQILETAKEQSPSPQKALWQFQNLLQAIPDWNQDKVIRETDVIQVDCKCDYLEELLTAVFLAHTKVLSAIRLNTKQNKLQITIPKLDHFLHRVLSESARSLWTNAFLFAETSSFEKQKNLRQVSTLLQEAVIQAIRGMLPVKKILREYLQTDDDEEETKPVEKQLEEASKVTHSEEEKPSDEKPSDETSEEKKVEETSEENIIDETSVVEEEKKVEETPVTEEKTEEEKKVEDTPVTEGKSVVEETPVINIQTEDVKPETQSAQTIYIDTKPAVSFQQGHTFFSSDTLEGNTIEEAPFAEAELRPDEEEDDWDDEFEDLEELEDEDLAVEAKELNL
jgi:hypothetical protein